MTPPPREYWRVWSDSAQDYQRDCAAYLVEYDSYEAALVAAFEDIRDNRMLRQCPTDWRPVHCREVVIDG